jgi:hypothetical protein
VKDLKMRGGTREAKSHARDVGDALAWGRERLRRQNGQSSQPEPQQVGSSASRISGRNGVVASDGTAADAPAAGAPHVGAAAGAVQVIVLATAPSSARAFSSRAVCSSFTGE